MPFRVFSLHPLLMDSSNPVPIPLHVVWFRHALPGDCSPGHCDGTLCLSPADYKRWLECENAAAFVSRMIRNGAPYYCSTDRAQLEALANAFGDWFMGDPASITDVGVYSLPSRYSEV